MSHATDGELHAYLDGALTSIDPTRADRLRIHLEGCSDCTARLEDARTLRSRAGEILADAAPDVVEAPPFEAILRRRAEGHEETSGADDPIPIPIRRTRPPLAWAASVAVALGAGWLGHAVWTGTPEADEAARSPMTQSPAVPGAGGPASAELATRATNLGLAEGEVAGRSSEGDELVAVESLDRIAVTGAVDDAPGISGGEADRRGPVRLEERAGGRADRQGVESPLAATSELERDVGERRNRRPSPAEPVPEPAREPEPSVVVAGQARRATEGITEAEEGNEARRALQKTAQDAPAVTRLADVEAGADARAEEAREGFANAPGDYFRDALAFDARLRGGQVTWSPVSRVHAEHWIGGPVPQVPDLPADLAIAALGEARLVRTIQTLPGGDTLELIQEALPAADAGQMREAPGAAPEAPARFEADFAQAPGAFLVIERDGFRVTARAQVAADSLQILLSRLR
jgi:hypothetical protein